MWLWLTESLIPNRREAEEEELEGLKEYLGSSGGKCENCGEDIDDDDDGCCKYRRMQLAK